MTANTATLTTWKNLQTLAPQQLPGFVIEDSAMLYAFVKAYYEWMDKQNNANFELRNLVNYQDIDRTLDKFIEWFQSEFIPRIPEDVLANKRLLIKHIKDFYKAKGSQRAYEFLFRILYNEDVEFYYPGRDMLRLSWSNWVAEKYLYIQPAIGITELLQLGGKEIIGGDSGARTRVEKIEIERF